MKYFYCKICNKYVGEMSKGRVRKDTVFVCKECDKNISQQFNNNAKDIFDFLGVSK